MRFFRPQPRHWLIKEEQAWFGRKRHRKLKLALLTMTQPGNKNVSSAFKSYSFEGSKCRLPQLTISPRIAPKAE